MAAWIIIPFICFYEQVQPIWGPGAMRKGSAIKMGVDAQVQFACWFVAVHLGKMELV